MERNGLCVGGWCLGIDATSGVGSGERELASERGGEEGDGGQNARALLCICRGGVPRLFEAFSSFF